MLTPNKHFYLPQNIWRKNIYLKRFNVPPFFSASTLPKKISDQKSNLYWPPTYQFSFTTPSPIKNTRENIIKWKKICPLLCLFLRLVPCALFLFYHFLLVRGSAWLNMWSCLALCLYVSVSVIFLIVLWLERGVALTSLKTPSAIFYALLSIVDCGGWVSAL